MRITAFRVQNFRSIIDSGWQNLSQDNITALIGQNESGKSSILEALIAYETSEIYEDDTRSDGNLPRISISYKIEKPSEVFEISSPAPKSIISNEANPDSRINLVRTWAKSGTTYLDNLELEEAAVKSLFPHKIMETKETGEQVEKEITEVDFIYEFFPTTPKITLFSDKNSILPNTINIKDLIDKKSTIPGRDAVINWMQISGLNVEDLNNPITRYVFRHLSEANKKITTEFQNFWDQSIGTSNKIRFDCQLRHYSTSSPTPGEPFLEFWVIDENERLYPKQRSQGVIWYLSFFLQLKANSINGKDSHQLFLIDEPGTNLHAKAQLNVLQLFEELKSTTNFMYSTHSPFLVDSEKLYRIIAVQRENNDWGYSESKLYSVHKLGNANLDTLTPVFTAMGLSLNQNPVISRTDNIILEEISAHYYITTFYSLLDRTCTKHFIPAQGVSKVPVLANLFLGWGLEFSVAIDGDPAGRRVYNDLKRYFCQNDDELAKSKLLKIMDNGGIENIFTEKDFENIVAKGVVLDSSKSLNSDKVRDNSKAIIASRFKMRVASGEIIASQFSKKSLESITKLLDSLDNL